MATSSSSWADPPDFDKAKADIRLRELYPVVKESDTPLPRAWSSKDKYNFIGLSQNNLRVHYKVSKCPAVPGFAKAQKDAASVKSTYPIPPSCGIYYFEVKIVSKGRDGYMGIGLTAQGCNMNRLPGWDKNSFGYHGDDGHSFYSSGSGVPYGPTFSTGDVIGCGLNFVDGSCFYTKNGNYLGIAFRELPIRQEIYPTVGLQTPGEVVDTNFGQSPFVFDIHDMIRGLRSQVHKNIISYQLPLTDAGWHDILQKMVASYLCHQGYSETAEVFAKSTSQELEEDVTSIQNRQKIQKLVLSGQIRQAMRTVEDLYPGLLSSKPNLVFALKIRQFIELINGTACETKSSSAPNVQSNIMCSSNKFSPSIITNGSTAQPTSVIQSTKNVLNTMNSENSSVCTDIISEHNNQESNGSLVASNGSLVCASEGENISQPSSDGNSETSSSAASSQMNDSDVDMDCEDSSTSPEFESTKNNYTNGFRKDNGNTKTSYEEDQPMDVAPIPNKICGGDLATIDHMLELGKELQHLLEKNRRENNEDNKMLLQNAFSLLAYTDPWNSPVGWQLDPSQREGVCQMLNSAIVESRRMPPRSNLETCIAQTKQSIRQMIRSGVGISAFSTLESFTDGADEHISNYQNNLSCTRP